MEWREQLRAALADAEPGTLASGRSAARVWGIRIGPPTIELWHPSTSAPLPGMTPDVRDGLGVVDAPTMLLQIVHLRTVSDLATGAASIGVPLDELSRRATEWITARGPRSRDVRLLSEHLEGVARPDSGLEARFLQILDRAGLRRQAVLHHPVTIGASGRRIELDFAFPARSVVVELDGWAYHRSPESFARDRSRDVELAALGWLVLRFTHADVERRPAWVVEQIRQTLRTRTPAGS